jgi:16S rRNA (cytidine1402-2'-O)-methyltransferase|tara:strand:+ start:1141 stop:1851 length:711 start_codon:yes stop_codon:yes gene_type:complete
MSKGTVYLIPCPIGTNNPADVLPEDTIKIIHELDYFIVENEKTCRQFLRAANHPKKIKELDFEVLNKHTDPMDVINFIKPCLEGKSVGVISESGCPGVADPGSFVVKTAHQKAIQVVPLIGPSSILLSLMASGFNGQSFSFVGYVPKDKAALKKRLSELEGISRKFNQTQIFIETPFRNKQLIENIKQYCSPNTDLCVAANINQPDEIILRKPLSQWKTNDLEIHKIPAVFLIQAN